LSFKVSLCIEIHKVIIEIK